MMLARPPATADQAPPQPNKQSIIYFAAAAALLLLAPLAALCTSLSSPPGPPATCARRPCARAVLGARPGSWRGDPPLSPPPPGHDPPANLTDLVNAPYYQARLRPLALELGPRHPIRAARPPHALFADVRLSPWLGIGSSGSGSGGSTGDDGGKGFAALLAASDGGDPRGVPEHAGAYEIFFTEEQGSNGGGGGGGGDQKNSTPAAPGSNSSSNKRRARRPCFDAAMQLFPEPFHPSMLVRNRTVPTSWAGGGGHGKHGKGGGAEGKKETEAIAPSPLTNTKNKKPPPRQPPHPYPTKLPPALWRWDNGTITRASFDSIPLFLGSEDCRLCYDVMKYKLHHGRLYRFTRDCSRDLRNASAPPLPAGATRCPADWRRGRVLEELLLVAAYLYRLPDGEMAVHRGDGAAAGHPVMQHNVRRDHPLAGFALPYPEHWVDGAPSARQAAAWAACTRARYGPLAGRRRTRGGRGGSAGAAAAAEDARRRRGGGAGAGGGQREGGAAKDNNKNNNDTSDDRQAAGASCARAPVIPRAVWRGTTTDPRRGAWLHELLATARARLHALSLVHRDALDARLVAVAQMDEPLVGMAADKKAAERLLAIPSSFAAGTGGGGGGGGGSSAASVAWGAGGEAAAKREAAARLAECGGQESEKKKKESAPEDKDNYTKNDAGGDDEDEDEQNDDGLPRPPLYIPMEDYSRYAAVLDVDGNGWSARLWSLLLGASARPVLKQATPLAAYYEHLFAPGRHFAHFRGDLRDVAPVARRFARFAADAAGGGGRGGGGAGGAGGGAGSEGGEGGSQADEQENKEEEDEEEDEGVPRTAPQADALAREAAALAALALNRWAMVEAAAAAMEAYLERTGWRAEPPRPGDGWDLVPFSSCCEFGRLPAEFVAAMRAERD